jgi:uncharacterized membrane protein YhiD involved in acid resistance
VTKRKSILLGIGVVVAILLGLYFNGNLDRTLYPVGLNFHECARNGFGATFCGKELDEYRARIERVKETVTHTKENLETSEREAGQKAKEAAHESEQQQQLEAAARRNKEMRQLVAKMTEERHIYESEPETSVAGATAKGTYEADRAQLQQLQVEQKNSAP